MPKVLPSDVAVAIETAFPWATSVKSPPVALLSDGPAVAGLVAVIDRLPEATLQLSADEYQRFVWAVAALQHLAKRFELATVSAGGGWPWPFLGNQHVVTELWQLLKKCPDEGIEASTSALEFLDDEHLRLSVRSDVSSIEVALNNGQWKAATVLAGSVVEALLLWNVKKDGDAQRRSALQAAMTNLKLSAGPDEWVLGQYIDIAQKLGDISRATADQARLAKDFRNLIHPGREVRKRMRCDRGTAHAAFAALNLVIVDLEKLWAGSSK